MYNLQIPGHRIWKNPGLRPKEEDCFQYYDSLYLLKLLLTPDFGFYENLGTDKLGNHPRSMKAPMTNYLDTPRLHETMSDEHQDDLLATMGK